MHAQNDAEGAEEARATFLKELHLYEFEVGKAKRMARANVRELEAYSKKQEDVETKIQSSSEHISQLKVDLAAAKTERRHREEYDMIARKILELPSRGETTNNMAKLRQEIADLEAENERLDAEHATRCVADPLVCALAAATAH